MSTIIFIQVVLTMKKTLSIILCLALVILSFTACSSSNALTEENVTKTVDTGFSGRADYGEEDKALGREDELEMRGLEEGHGLSQKDVDI